MMTIESLSSMTSDVIKNQASLPTDIQYRLLLKMEAIRRDSSMNMHNLSRHFHSLLGNLSYIHDREVLFTHHTEELSLNIDPEEITRMSERIHGSKLKSKVKFWHQILINCIDPSIYILETLVTKGVLTSQQKAVVDSKPSPEIRAEELISILSNSEHPNAFSIFKESLQRDHAEIVRMIDEIERPDKHNALIEPEEHPFYIHSEYQFILVNNVRFQPVAYILHIIYITYCI